VLIASALAYTIGLLLMALGGPALGLNLGGGVIAGVGIAGTSFGVLLGAVSRAVTAESRSQMVGLVSAAGSLGTLVLAPLGQALITGYGWRTALLVFAGVALLMGAVGALIGRPPQLRPRQATLKRQLRQARRCSRRRAIAAISPWPFHFSPAAFN
jgi:predicted MFS family arabinose efflux permease